jgi:hypothetical protein
MSNIVFEDSLTSDMINVTANVTWNNGGITKTRSLTTTLASW